MGGILRWSKFPSPPPGDSAEPTGEDAKSATFYTVALWGEFAQIPAERHP